MKEYLSDAVNEIKRVDHLIFVSLKYTRTVDVIRSVVERILNAFDFVILELLEYAKEKKKIKEYPLAPGMKVDLLKKTFPDNEELMEYLNFYLLMRRVIRAEFTKREEYRRHVTMIATLDTNDIVEVDIDKLREHYEKTKEFVKFVKNIVDPND